MVLFGIALFSLISSFVTIAVVTNSTSTETSKEEDKQSKLSADLNLLDSKDWKVVPIGRSSTRYSKGLGSKPKNLFKYADPLGTANRTWWHHKFIVSEFPSDASRNKELNRIFRKVKLPWSLQESNYSLNWACHKALGKGKLSKKPKLKNNIEKYCSLSKQEIKEFLDCPKSDKISSKSSDKSFAGNVEQVPIIKELKIIEQPIPPKPTTFTTEVIKLTPISQNSVENVFGVNSKVSSLNKDISKNKTVDEPNKDTRNENRSMQIIF